MEQQKRMVEKFVSVLFMSRGYAHRAHLRTSSYAKHIALNDFYDSGDDDVSDVIDYADRMAEVAQGKMGKLNIPVTELKGDIEDPVDALSTHATMLENIGSKCGDRALSAIVDEVLGFYMQTIYKLKFLD